MLVEARNACAASFRTIASTGDSRGVDRLFRELKAAGVQECFGARIDAMLRSYERAGLVRHVPAQRFMEPLYPKT
jgi:hypothetical protein